MAGLDDPFRLDGKVALVSGGTRGIGFGVCERLIAQGARVVVSSEDAAAVREAATALGPNAHGLVCDVADTDACAALVEGAHAWGGQLDVLVCAAGITGRPGPRAGLDLDDFERVMAVNLRSMVALTGAAMPRLAQTRGSAVLLASLSASRGNQSLNTYALAKAGVVQLARNLAVQWGPQGVRVNSIAPGLIRTALSGPLLADEAFMRRRMAMTPLRRVGEVDETAAATVFLATPAAGFITGHNLLADGGALITDGS